MSTSLWKAALAAVEHGQFCVTRTEFAECSCDRDVRIAKGIERSMRVARSWHTEPEYLNDRNGVLGDAKVLTAFTEASR